MRTHHLLAVTTIILLVSGVTTAGHVAADAVSGSYAFLTFNIRNGRANDGDDSWPNRREHVAALIRESGADVAGLQEVFDFQRAELLELLPEYGAWGIGRGADGTDEQCCILYRRDRLQLLEGGTFWLSTTPGIPGSRSWDSSLPRICTWARFLDAESGRAFYFYNNHFDHRGEQARAESARLLSQRIAARGCGNPVVITGDLNTDEDTEPVAILKEHLRDSFRMIHPDAEVAGTFNGFKNDRGGAKIDYVFVDEQADVLGADIIYDTYGDGRNYSDHFPVRAEVTFR